VDVLAPMLKQNNSLFAKNWPVKPASLALSIKKIRTMLASAQPQLP